MIENMPLRRIPDLGSRVFKLIVPVLEKYNGIRKENQIWRCKDFLNTPVYALKSCIADTGGDHLFDLLSNRCKGIDTMTIDDDNGGLTKTVSVEETFIRGSLISLEGVKRNLEILYTRLLRLLDLRRDASPMRMYAYPSSLRLSVRIVDKSKCTGKRPFRIISKQVDFDGKELMCMKDNSDRVGILKRAVSKVLHIVSDLQIELDVTKLNVAALCFADIKMQMEETKSKSISTFFQSTPSGTNQHLGQFVEERMTNEPRDVSVMKVESNPFKRNSTGRLSNTSKYKQMKLQPLVLSKASTVAVPKDLRKANHTRPGHQKKHTGIEQFFLKK
jgi:hypothetical protein